MATNTQSMYKRELGEDIVSVPAAVYIGTDGKAYLAKADNPSTMPAVGFVENTGVAGETAIVRTNDVMDGFSGLTALWPAIFLSQTVAGGVQARPTSGLVQMLGVPLSDTLMDIHIGMLENLWRSQDGSYWLLEMSDEGVVVTTKLA